MTGSSRPFRLAVLGNAGSWYCEEIARAAERHGCECRRIEFGRLVAATNGTAASEVAAEGRPLRDFDAVVVRTMPPASLEQVVYRMDVLSELMSRGCQVVNPPKAIECAVDKFLTSARLSAAGLPVPRTVVCENSQDAQDAFESLGQDVVVKPIFGSEGRGIVRVSDRELALRTFRTLERIGAVLYLQEYVAHPGYDLRLLVLDGEIVGAMRRNATNDFRTNVAQQGQTQPHAPTRAECDLALTAAEVTGCRFAGVDLLYDRTGDCYVIEVNAVPGWRAFAQTTGIDVAALLIDSIVQRQHR